RLFARLRLWRQHFDRAAGLLYRGYGGFRGAVDRKRNLGLDFTGAEEPDAVLGAANDAGFEQRRRIDLGRGIEHAGVDRRLDAAEIHLVELAREHGVFETALRHAAVQRHLAALKALDAHAGTRGLALAAAAAGLARARTNAAADPLADLTRAGRRGEFVKFHCSPRFSNRHAQP